MRAEEMDVVERIFTEAIELPPEARRRHVERACEGASALCDGILRLLDADAAAGTADLPSPTTWLPTDSHTAGEVIGGRFRLVRPIGTGGLGVVWQAEQIAPVMRPVAIKFIRHDFDGRNVFLRFALERSALARMDHPGIARILDAGCDQDGRPYFAMELVAGQPITIHCDEARMEIADRVALLADVCQAVHHAHQKGILHRDLKPSNILVTLVDGRPVPKIIDFGIAKAVAPETDQSEVITAVTRAGQFVGTPAYMAPEQLVGDGFRVDVRSDIFALGVLLHELLAGCLPHDRPSRQAINPLVSAPPPASVAPRPPSSSIRRLSRMDAVTVAARRRETPRSLRRRLRGELDWVAGRAMAEEPARRYASASELAEDLRRWLRGQPVAAGPPGARYRMCKFAQRHKTAVAAALLLVVTLALGLVGTSLGLLRAREAERRQRDLSEAAESAARSEADQRRLALTAARRAELSSYVAQIAAVESAIGNADTVTARRFLSATDPDLRGWEWARLDRRSDQSDLVIDVGGGEAWGVAFSPDGAEVLVTSQDGSLRSFDVMSGAPRARLDLGFSGPFWLAVSSIAGRVCVGSHSRQDPTKYEYHLLEWPGGRVVARGSGRTLRRPFSPDGSLVAVAEPSAPLIRLLHASDGSEARSIELPEDTLSPWAEFEVEGPLLGFWSDKQQVAGAVDLADGSIRRWTVPNLRLSAVEPTTGLCLGTNEHGDVCLMRLGGEERPIIIHCRVPQDAFAGSRLSPDRTIVIGACSRSGAIQLHEVATDRPLGVLLGHLSRVIDAAISADGRRLASAATDGTVRVWRLPIASDRLEVPLTDGSGRLGAAISGDGARVASGGWGSVQMWRSADAELLWAVDLGIHYVELLSFSPDEARLAVAETNGRAMILSTADGTIERQLSRVQAGHTALGWDPLGRWVVLGGADGSLHLLSPDTGEEVGVVPLFDGPVTALALSSDGAHFAAGAGLDRFSGDSWSRIITAPRAAPELVIGSLEDRSILVRIPLTFGVSALCMTPDGQRLFVGREDGAVLELDLTELLRTWSTRLGACPPHLEAIHLEAIHLEAPQLDAPQLESRGVWCIPPSASTTRLPATAPAIAPRHEVTSLACTPDGSRLLVGQRSGSACIALPGEDGLLMRVTSSGSVHAVGLDEATGALVVACRQPFIAFEGARPSPEVAAARERTRLIRAIVDPIVAEEGILERVLARIDASIEEESMRRDARRHAEARGEHRALLVNQAILVAREPSLREDAYRAALVRIEHLRDRDRTTEGAAEGRFDPLLARLHLRLGRPDRTVALLEPLLRDGGGAGAIADLSVPAVLAMARLRDGDAAEAEALMEAVERRLESGESLRGEAMWFVPQARAVIRRGS